MKKQNIITTILLFILSTSIYSVEKGGVSIGKRDLANIDNHMLATHRTDRYIGTLKKIYEKKFLRVLTTANDLNYFTYKGGEKGFEYYYVTQFIKQLNKKINLKKREQLRIEFEMIPVHRDELLSKLESGFGDIAAAGLTITKERKEKVNFSIPYLTTNEVLISLTKEKEITNIKDLSGKIIGVRKSSSYYQHLAQINRELEKQKLPPAKIVEIKNDLDTISIIELLATKKSRYNFTISDSHLAALAKKIFSNKSGSTIKIHNKFAIKKKQKIAWAVNKKSGSKLLDEINSYLSKNRQKTMIGNMQIKAYFKGIKAFEKSFNSKNSLGISKYDSLVKKYTKRYSKEFKMPMIDWRLLSALMYQESKFNPAAKNPSGAVGLFQIKPSSAKDVGITNIAGTSRIQIENNINAGVKYLYSLMTRYFKNLKGDAKDSDFFRIIIAAYNAGPGNVKRAIASTKAIKLDDKAWFRNIEIGMLKLKRRNVRNSRETIEYVSSINRKFLMFIEMGYPPI